MFCMQHSWPQVCAACLLPALRIEPATCHCSTAAAWQNELWVLILLCLNEPATGSRAASHPLCWAPAFKSCCAALFVRELRQLSSRQARGFHHLPAQAADFPSEWLPALFGDAVMVVTVVVAMEGLPVHSVQHAVVRTAQHATCPTESAAMHS
jgi:hypothetical protein